MHIIQTKLLELIKKQDLSDIGYRKIGAEIGVDHPQKVKWHLEKLVRDGKILRNYDGQFSLPKIQKVSHSIIMLPVLGRANCGEPLLLAGETAEEPVQVSKSLLPRGRADDCFAVRAEGNSMNKANIKGQPIRPRDLVVVDSSQIAPKNGDYVVASIDGYATIKRFSLDNLRRRVMLMPESSERHNPIVLDQDNLAGLRIHGKVIDVIPTAA